MSTRNETIRLRSADGKELSAYRALPARQPKAGIVVIQEIFGVNPHIRRVADGYAEQGYEVLAPALFDRIEPGVEFAYDGDGIAKGRGLIQRLGWDAPLADIGAAAAALASNGKVGVVGYCWGGTLAFLSAARVDGIAAAVGYYGTAISKQLDATPKVPTLLHFGEKDASVPPADIETIRRRQPELSIEVYPADHGFNCDARGSYHAPSAALALERTLAFFARHLSP
ncbi:MAG TPA: dienelactone hydrolase family protein [Polyangiales bacterium]